MSLLIRKGGLDDIAEMVSLDALCFPEGIRYDTATFAFWFSHPHATGFVAESQEDDKKIMTGFVLCAGDRGREQVAHLITLDVHPLHRRQGIGRKLLAMVEKEMEKKGLKKIVLEVYTRNLDALKLYQAHDYRILAMMPDYYGQDQDGYLMLKEL